MCPHPAVRYNDSVNTYKQKTLLQAHNDLILSFQEKCIRNLLVLKELCVFTILCKVSFDLPLEQKNNMESI